MQQKLATAFVVLLVIGLLAVVIAGSKKQLSSSSDKVNNTQTLSASQTADLANSQQAILFYGNTCPHCQQLETWMEDNGVFDKVQLVKKEVYDDQDNARQLTGAATICNLDPNNIGVPFLFADKQCYVGLDQAKTYLTQKAGLSSNQ